MKLTPDLKTFIYEHIEDDIHRLLLTAARYPDMDVVFAAEQISARRQIKNKLPEWYNNPDLIFPSKLSVEQSSSELTAIYKQTLVTNEDILCDLTGGLGIDSYYFSRKVRQVTYIERFANYCEAALHNFSVLKTSNIEVLHGESGQILKELQKIDVFYIDPARRGESNKRLFALEDCEPNLLQLIPLLFEKAPRIIAKISPMADIQQTLFLLPHVSEVHVISVRNECKELLFILERDKSVDSPMIDCCNFLSDGSLQKFDFLYREEGYSIISYASKVKRYLYEPNASILKGGAFKIITRCGVEKLHKNSHLYTSDKYLPEFPGRIFHVEEISAFHNKSLKTLHRSIPKANITVRNFPLSVTELRKRSKITEGGDTYIFATTMHKEEKVLIRTKKI